MITGVLVLSFVLFMVFWWASQGVFTAFLHLMAVIAAGAIAFALWEPVGVGFLLDRQYDYARGVALLSCFLLSLLIIRALFDNLIVFNMKFNQIVNFIAGGLCGFFSGILTSGIVIIGLSMMPVGQDLGGYRPYTLDSTGQVSERANLFPMNVDSMTIGFYNRLSLGAFSTGTPLAAHHPDLHRQAFVYRMTYDKNAALSVGDEGLKIPQIYALDSPIRELSPEMATAIGKPASAAGYTVYAVITEWFTKAGAADRDGTIRVPPTQVRLQVVGPNADGVEGRELVAPIGFTLTDAASQAKIYHPVNNNTDFGYVSRDNDTMIWLFAVKNDQTPEFVIVRQNRYRIVEILKPAQNPTQMTRLLGTPVGGQVAAANTQTGENGEPAVVSSAISQPFIGKNFPENRIYSRPLSTATIVPSAGPVIREGKGILRSPTPGNRPDPEVILREIGSPTQFVVVQMPFNRDGAYTYLKAAMNLAANLQTVSVQDNNGSLYQPVGYMIQKGPDLVFKLDPQNKIRNIAEINDLDNVKAGDVFYFIFHLPKGVRLVQFNAGNKKEDIDLLIPQ